MLSVASTLLLQILVFSAWHTDSYNSNGLISVLYIFPLKTNWHFPVRLISLTSLHFVHVVFILLLISSSLSVVLHSKFELLLNVLCCCLLPSEMCTTFIPFFPCWCTDYAFSGHDSICPTHFLPSLCFLQARLHDSWSSCTMGHPFDVLD